MTLRVEAEPDGGRAIVHAALGRRAYRSDHLQSLQGAPQTAAALPLYVLSEEALSSEHPVALARRAGWRYPIVGGAEPGLALLSHRDGGHVYAGIIHGVLPRRLLEASAFAEDALGESQEPFAARLLEVPTRLLSCLWLAGPEDHFISLLGGSPPGTAPLKLSDDLRPLLGAIKRARVRRPPEGGPGI